MDMLDHVPSFQRETIHFINMQLAHLRAQITQLEKAKQMLGGQLEDVDLTIPNKPLPKAKAVVEPKEQPQRVPLPDDPVLSKRPYLYHGNVKPKVIEALKECPRSVSAIADMTGYTTKQVGACLQNHTPMTFRRVAHTPTILWGLKGVFYAEEKVA